jgi:hypothetical protein
VRLFTGLLLGGSVGACSVLASFDGLSGGGGADAGAGSAFTGSASDDAGSSTGSDTDPGDARAPTDSTDGSTGASRGDAASAPPMGGSGEDALATTSDSAVLNTVDSSTAPDTSTGVSNDAAPAPYCTSLSHAPLFCDDFDEGALAAPWDQVSSGEGSAALDATYSVSAPNAMLSSVNNGSNATAVDVAGYKSFEAKQGVAGLYTLTFDLRIDTADLSGSSDAVLGAIQLWNGSAYWDVELELTSYGSGAFGVSMSEDGSSPNDYVSHAASATLAIHAWTSVSIAITLPAGSGGATLATLSFNGTQVASATVHVSTSDPIPEIVVGPTYASSASSGWAVRYDNVTFN